MFQGISAAKIMLQLRNFILTLNRVAGWSGVVPGSGVRLEAAAKEAMSQRIVMNVLTGFADLLPAKNWQKGLTIDKVSLSLGQYSRRSVYTGLSVLVSSGIIRSERNKRSRSGLEGWSTIFINPALILLSRQHSKAIADHKKGGQNAKNWKAPICPEVTLPFLTWGPVNPHGLGIPRDPCAELARDSVQILPAMYGIHTPPIGGGGGDAVFSGCP